MVDDNPKSRQADGVNFGADPRDLPDLAVFRDGEEPWFPEMVVIPTGEFRMGSPPDEAGRTFAEGPQREVIIAYRFALSRYAVTFAHFDHFCEAVNLEKPTDDDWGRGARPVINVSWHDATAYLEWLSEETGHTYRLPSEVEWEYACRAGTTTPFSFGDTITPDHVNYDGNFPYGKAAKGVCRGKTVPVGSLPPNPWALHEMHGNVWEWSEDYWHDGYFGAPSTGQAWINDPDGAGRVLRGGSWYNDARVLRSAFRGKNYPGFRNGHIGFRCVRDMEA